MSSHAAELAAAQEACVAAGEILMAHYDRGPIEVVTKADDSPVTAADLEANERILAILAARFPADAILSEETADEPSRLGRARVWIVDPLDGTRDFVARSGDFAVHVGLAVHGRPLVGVVFSPAAGELYWAVAGEGAYCRDDAGTRRLQVSTHAELSGARTGVTRLARAANLERFLADTGLAASAFARGASLKMMAVADGLAEISVCLHGREKAWDTCAPELIVTEAGGRATDLDGAPFVYNQASVALARGILMSNGPLHDRVAALARPYFEA